MDGPIDESVAVSVTKIETKTEKFGCDAQPPRMVNHQLTSSQLTRRKRSENRRDAESNSWEKGSTKKNQQEENSKECSQRRERCKQLQIATLSR